MCSSRLTACFTSLFCCLAMLVISGCGATLSPFKPIETRHIELRADNIINNGQDLEVDVIYITYVQELREVSRIGPELWFEKERRDQWKFKESVVMKGGDRVLVKLDPLILKRTVLLVVFANFVNEMDPGKQQVIVDYAGKERELIRVKKSSLFAENKSLQYIK